ncbi:hypothetical protein INS49_012028 [Diaporthe citri]|uniref:uncharacterized protein n=1 Tax=Diaporthe citri TaxID=83186 RepID=UPI001C818743|nr:uncharacterized protein INS49_012028 [Diaporthe citri]KAG6360960.1 hypothetical protein INS49_012028 [Diaporthe citri]
MASKNAFLDGRWVPADSRITYQNFKHWEAAMRQSHEMAQTQADGQHLRQLSMCGPASPTFTPQTGCDKQSEIVHETNPDAIVFHLARNRPALDALRRTRKMRYRHNLKFLAASFPLADEQAKKDKQARKAAEKKAEEAQGLTAAEILAQKELAKKKIGEKTVEELKYIREMKAAKVKAAATERIKDKEAKNGITGKGTEKATGKKVKSAARKSAEKAVQRSTSLMPPNVFAMKTAEKVAQGGFCPMPPNIFAMKAPKRAGNSIEEADGESAEETAPKSTGSTAGRKSGKKTLRAKMMPKMKRW